MDVSGRVVADLLQAHAFQVVSRLGGADEQGEIEDALRQQCEVASLVVTTRGTGISPRRDARGDQGRCSRILDGFAELMRAEGRNKRDFAPLEPLGFGHTRPISDSPSTGSPAGAQASLDAGLSLIPHA